MDGRFEKVLQQAQMLRSVGYGLVSKQEAELMANEVGIDDDPF